ncbi:MAG: hypothetical protein AAFP90_18765 [Planctomycetota bacterium]
MTLAGTVQILVLAVSLPLVAGVLIYQAMRYRDFLTKELRQRVRNRLRDGAPGTPGETQRKTPS